ncbi:ATP-dependent Clp protease ATP-binding subunit ClpL [Madurella mycetomatis]|uniref:ATP-dependent Clp protease ATP-binding subunit ClpL n=1 Tax=Madurella mycetomatis TaxID=100816 RepID=A0A175W5D0_9PEZI|nr:ATP-dependent Clp protease ATP-binding subunit ClpL [Madurella mycetomatis]
MGEKMPEQPLGLPVRENPIREAMNNCSSRKRAIAALQLDPTEANSDDEPQLSKRYQLSRDSGYVESKQLEDAVNATDKALASTKGDGARESPNLSITSTSILASFLGVQSVSSGAKAAVTDWDFILPTLPYPDQPNTTEEAGPRPFDILNLVRDIQHGAARGDIARYLADHKGTTVERGINDSVEGFPAIFYVVARNDEALLRIWVAHGGDVSAVHSASGAPLLAFAIVQSEIIQQDTTMLLAALLGLGAPSEAVPPEFYTPYHHDLPVDGPILKRASNGAAGGHAPPVWCTPATSRRLARTANLGQRYYLWRAARLTQATTRSRQVAVRKKAQAVLEIPYFLVGQTTASDRLLHKLISHIMIPSERPLVLAFAGPSGHGKTELARRLGYLLSLDLEVVDCAIVSWERELFGPRHPFSGAGMGSPLNNFLAKHADQRCIVFLDEFEKTTSDIHQALLLPFDNATNALDDKINTFCNLNTDIISGPESRKEQLARKLSRSLKKEFLSRFGAPITGRISEFIPFLPFSEGEQAVIVHKFLQALISRVAAPVNLSSGSDEWLLGDIKLRIRHDASVCMVLAKECYIQELGARSLSEAVKKVEDMLVEFYLNQSGEIVEGGRVLEVVLSMDEGEVVLMPAHRS